jgi:glycosyltransferase involved in cell wall biosynthesis
MTRARSELILSCPRELTTGVKTREVAPSAFFAEAGPIVETDGSLREPEKASTLLLKKPAKAFDTEFRDFLTHKLETFALSASGLNRFLKDPIEFLRIDLLQVPFGVDTNQFTPGEKSATPIILFVGGLDRQHNFKGVEQLIDAFALISKDYPSACLCIVGRGDLEDYYRGRIASHQLGEKAKILNSVSDTELAGLFNSAWVTVLPSTNRAEAFGLVLLESLASGTAVIASNLAGVRNVFRNNEQGYLVRPGDVSDLAQKLEKIVSSKERTVVLGNAGRKWVEKQYNWKEFSQRLEAAYCRVLYTPKKLSEGPLIPEDDD